MEGPKTPNCVVKVKMMAVLQQHLHNGSPLRHGRESKGKEKQHYLVMRPAKKNEKKEMPRNQDSAGRNNKKIK